MALPPDIGELWKALRTAWLADTLLKQLINQSAQGGSIYLEMPHNKVPFPLLVLKVISSEINIYETVLGRSYQTLQLNAYSTDRYFGGKVFAAMENNWCIPRQRDEFTSTNWRITDMNWTNPIDLGKLRIDDDDQDIWGFACQARAYVRRRDS